MHIICAWHMKFKRDKILLVNGYCDWLFIEFIPVTYFHINKTKKDSGLSSLRGSPLGFEM